MPRDDDEDAAAPLGLDPPPAPAVPVGVPPRRPAPPPPAPARTAPFKFGVCGAVHTAGELAALPGGTGIARLVSGGVGYTPPPVARAWRAVPAEPGRFDLPWDADPAAARTLAALRADLDRAARGGLLPDADHPLLRELDETAVALARTAAELHRAGWGLGLVQPDNVVTRGPGGGRETVLLDLGFAWRGTFGGPPWDDSPGRPEWLDPAGPFAWVWDQQPVRQQYAAPDSGFFPPPDPVADVRAVARLVAWLLTGVPARDCAAGGRAGAAPVWGVLAAAADGRVPTADALAARLRAAAPSEHFVPLPLADHASDQPRKGGGPARRVVGLVFAVVVVAGAGGWFALNHLRTNKAVDPTPGTPGGVAPGGAAPQAPTPTPAADPGRAKAFDDVPAEVAEILQVAADPARRVEAGERFAALRARLERAAATGPAPAPDRQQLEQQCLDIVADYARQFGPPR